VTIHDVSYARVPQWNAYKNDPARRWFYRRGALAADRVITDSQFSQHEISAAYGISPTAIDVVPLAAAESFTPGVFDESRVPDGVRRPYLLHVGDLQVRRNLETALAALIGVRRGSDRGQTGVRPLLVCAGVDRGTGDTLRGHARAAGDPDALVLTGAVDDAALLNLYRGAEMLVYPSRYEGFGLPILEAMRCGVPVVAARTSSIPEVAGDAGILVDALDVTAWTDAIARILGDRQIAADLRARSIARAAEFSWDRTARETLASLRACAGVRR
jgi:glycosyltransferase involved in cell wall biosynthesis